MPYPVKAANVFLTDDGSADGSVKLGDFGISKASSTQTTSPYTSPYTPLLSPRALIHPLTPRSSPRRRSRRRPISQ